ncbi:NlpC/P60 family protein, partial [Clostridioides difficile]
TYNAGSYVTHVGIYVGNNQMYHAGDPIGYADLNSSYWQQHLIGAGRVK